MFVNSEHLPQVLSSQDYISQQQFDCEVSNLFDPAWHLVATSAEIPCDGDYLATSMLGRPLLIWKRGGEYHCFLNVCPHRFSRIARPTCGHAGERLRCQYHGWEFDETGNTRKIPDARCFKPMTQNALGLTKYRTETCGQLIFVSLVDDGPSLREALGPVYDVAKQYCAANLRPCGGLKMEYDVNWKIKVENSIESYHLDMVHTGTFGRTPEPEDCSHELRAGWSYFRAPNKPANAWQQWLDRLVHRLAGDHVNENFEHYLVYPHLMFGSVGLFSWAEIVLPLGPTRTLNTFKLFGYGGSSGSLKSRLLSNLAGRAGLAFFKKVAEEDAGIIREVQHGHFSARQPSQGVISVREERCFHFQEYVKRSTSNAQLVQRSKPA